MKVKEIVTLDAETKRGLWNYICQHDSMVNELEFITHEKELLLFSINEPRVKLETTPYFMARIVDVEMFFKQYKFNWENEVGELVLEVSDSHAVWNNQMYILRKDSIVTGRGDLNKDNRIKLSINALSTILFGYKTPSELVEIGQVEGDNEEIKKFERLIPKRESFFYDFF
jgi:predicted acetyltransferase